MTTLDENLLATSGDGSGFRRTSGDCYGAREGRP